MKHRFGLFVLLLTCLVGCPSSPPVEHHDAAATGQKFGTIAFKKKDTRVFTATVGIGATVDVTGGGIQVTNDATVFFEARLLFSHFAGGHQNAGGSLLATFAAEGQNGTYSAIPVMTNGVGVMSANPTIAGAWWAATNDTNIAGGGGLVPVTATWSVGGATGLAICTVVNNGASAAAFDVTAFVDIYSTASQ